jgi:thiol:disulfide interchange protein DsbD
MLRKRTKGESTFSRLRQHPGAVRWLLLLLFVCAVSASAQISPVRWSAHGPAKALHAGERFELTIDAAIDPEWHIYSITQPAGGPTRTEISIPAGQLWQSIGSIKAAEPHVAFDPNFEMKTEIYEERAKFTVPAIVATDAKEGHSKGVIDVRFQACNETTCLPAKTVHIPVVLKIVAVSGTTAKSVTVPQLTSGNPSAPVAPPSLSNAPVSVQQKPNSQSSSPVLSSREPRQSLGAFVWLAAVMGALSLLTPCVFPMIPITVSYFTNHAGKDRRSAIMTALVYALGIVLTFTGFGLLLAVIFGAGGINQLAANPWVNLFITAVFLGFAFSLFGAYFIQAPQSLLQKLSTITRNENGGGVFGALLMGFTFTLTSFTCTAPFVGTLLVMTAEGNWRWPLVGMLAFSSVFATPFFVLAVVPQIMSRLPKAGGWMVSVKVVMGFLEIAAAMKFLSSADLVWRWGIFTRQVVLAVWIAVGLLIVLYVLGYFRMEHDSRVESVGVGRITVAIVSLAIVIWLLPGLFGKQLGELESFLPPEIASAPYTGGMQSAASAPNADSGWFLNDYDGALAKAVQENKPVFVDFTGYTCTNCRWMEANMFSRPEVAKEMDKFVRVRLYTDGAGELYGRQQRMQQAKFGTVALPYYAILKPDGATLRTFPGLTRNATEFIAFLNPASRNATH